VLEAAMRLADEHGIEALSMRRLAKELGVEAMSLYNHVANKDEILNGLVEAVAAEVELPSDDEHWKSSVRQVVLGLHGALLRHEWTQKIWTERMGGAARFAYADAMLGNLAKGGFSDDLIYHAYHILEGYIQGLTSMHLSFPYQPDEIRGMASTFLERFPSDEYPHLAEHIRQHMEPSHGDKGGFELGLDLILDGLETARDAA
jgi:AcrR family transcriptional regulator